MGISGYLGAGNFELRRSQSALLGDSDFKPGSLAFSGMRPTLASVRSAAFLASLVALAEGWKIEPPKPAKDNASSRQRALQGDQIPDTVPDLETVLEQIDVPDVPTVEVPKIDVHCDYRCDEACTMGCDEGGICVGGCDDTCFSGCDDSCVAGCGAPFVGSSKRSSLASAPPPPHLHLPSLLRAMGMFLNTPTPLQPPSLLQPWACTF